MFCSAGDNASEISEKARSKMNMLLNATIIDSDVQNDSNLNISSYESSLKNTKNQTVTNADDSLFLQTIIATFTSTMGSTGVSTNSQSGSVETSRNDFSTSGGECFSFVLSLLVCVFFSIFFGLFCKY